MGNIHLDAALLENSIGTLQVQANEKVLELVSDLAAVLHNTGDENKITQDLLTECRKFQGDYNEFVNSVKGSIEDMGQVVDLAEFHAKRASVGELQRRDLSFEKSGIDASKAMQQ